MRIALVAPLVSPIAPPYLGGAQALLADLARGLAQRGHEVTLYAAEGSDVPGVRVLTLGIDSKALRPARFYRDSAASADGERIPDMLRPDERKLLPSYAFLHVFRALVNHADEYDLVHAHAFDWPAYAYSSMLVLPVIHTLHLPAVDSNIANLLGMLAPPDGSPARVRLTTVSQTCAAGWAPHCAIAQVIYNGVDLAAIPFSAEPNPEPSLLFRGASGRRKASRMRWRLPNNLGCRWRWRAMSTIHATSSSGSRQGLLRWASASAIWAVCPARSCIGSWARRGRSSAHHTGRSRLGWWRARRRRRARQSLAIGAVGWRRWCGWRDRLSGRAGGCRRRRGRCPAGDRG